MSIRKLHGSWWVDFRFNNERFRKRSPLNTKQGAQEYEATLRGRLARGLPLGDDHRGEIIFEDFHRRYIRDHAEVYNKPTVVEKKIRMAAYHLFPVFGRKKLNAINAKAIAVFQRSLKQRGLAHKTINNIVGELQRVLRVAVEWGELDRVHRVKRLRVAKPPTVFLTVDEVRRLLSDRSEWRDVVLLAVFTGLRFGEVRALHWEDIDLERGMLTVSRNYVGGHFMPPKNYKNRHIPLSGELLALLRANAQPGGLVFEREQGGPLSQHAATAALTRMCKRRGVKHIGWHALRHTFASHLVMRGVPMRTVQSLLGHSSIQMTERYTHLSPESGLQAIARLTFDEAPRWAPATVEDARTPMNIEPKKERRLPGAHVWATGGQQATDFNARAPKLTSPLG
jgi:integrase